MKKQNEKVKVPLQEPEIGSQFAFEPNWIHFLEIIPE